jgi:Protein of unknown function (DUF3667)
MSGSKLRTSTDCLNCGKTVDGRYCAACGQENREPAESVGHLFQHFFEDLTHWDGKAAKSVKILFKHPGLLSKLYIQGKRHSYILPIRLYFVCTLILGLCSSVYIHNDPIFELDKKATGKEVLGPLLDSAGNIQRAIDYNDVDAGSGLTYQNFDSMFAVSKQKGFKLANEGFTKSAIKNLLKKNQESKSGFDFQEQVEKVFINTVPKFFFLLMPLFALLLFGLEASKPKNLFFNHFIFTIHFYCVCFVMYSLLALFNYVIRVKYSFVIGIVFMFIYLVKAISTFYDYKLGKSIVYSLITFLTSFFMLLLLTMISVGWVMFG